MVAVKLTMVVGLGGDGCCCDYAAMPYPWSFVYAVHIAADLAMFTQHIGVDAGLGLFSYAHATMTLLVLTVFSPMAVGGCVIVVEY